MYFFLEGVIAYFQIFFAGTTSLTWFQGVEWQMLSE